MLSRSNPCSRIAVGKRLPNSLQNARQSENLQLKPGEIPHVAAGAVNLAAAGTDADESFPSANRLLQRLLDAGLSQWEPDPEAALAPTQREEE